MAKIKEASKVLCQKEIATDIYSMWLESETIACAAKPGQFISLYCKDGSRLLPRPISICEIDKDKHSLRIVYRVAGKGTDEFSQICAGDTIDILGPLGNGFPIEAANGKKVILMGGGVGIPPMVETARQLDADKLVIAGYRDELFLQEELSSCCTLYTATEDGSAGTKGNVLDVMKEEALDADMIFACGPLPMLRAIKTYAMNNGITCYISMEEKMACGIGACLACVCRTKDVDTYSKVHNRRTCLDGPVFLSTEVEL